MKPSCAGKVDIRWTINVHFSWTRMDIWAASSVVCTLQRGLHSQLAQVHTRVSSLEHFEQPGRERCTDLALLEKISPLERPSTGPSRRAGDKNTARGSDSCLPPRRAQGMHLTHDSDRTGHAPGSVQMRSAPPHPSKTARSAARPPARTRERAVLQLFWLLE